MKDLQRNVSGPHTRRVQKLGVLALWLLLLAGLWVYAHNQGRTPTALLRDLLNQLRGEPWAPVWLLLIYLIRPVFLLPVSLLTVATGTLFGAVWGMIYAVVAVLLTATVAYLLGRFFGDNASAASRTVPQTSARGPATPAWTTRLRRYPFETVLLSRFLFVPGDLVNYAAGYLRVSWLAFIGATAIGGLPGLLIGVLAGASLESTSARVEFRPGYLVASAGLLIVSLGVSWVLGRRSSATKP